jgi:hypothetical protein
MSTPSVQAAAIERRSLGCLRPLYVANCSANKHFLLNSEENGEPLASLGE